MIDADNRYRVDLLDWWFRKPDREDIKFPALRERARVVLNDEEADEAAHIAILDAIDSARRHGAGLPDAPLESLSENEHKVLLSLHDAKRVRLKMVDLEVNTGLSKKVCGEICQALALRGLVDYPAKTRKGATITRAGTDFLLAAR